VFQKFWGEGTRVFGFTWGIDPKRYTFRYIGYDAEFRRFLGQTVLTHWQMELKLRATPVPFSSPPSLLFLPSTTPLSLDRSLLSFFLLIPSPLVQVET